MKADGFEDTDIKNVEEELIQLNVNLYIKRWLKHATAFRYSLAFLILLLKRLLCL